MLNHSILLETLEQDQSNQKAKMHLSGFQMIPVHSKI